MASEVQTAPREAAPRRRWLRATVLASLAIAVLAVLAAFGYELALSRVPQHRAALERLVRAQTGLDVRFTELGLRWGWYGPEAVFRDVELDQPGSGEALLRAPELLVGFDAWRTLRSGHPEAGRIELITPDIRLGSRTLARRLAAAANGGPVAADAAGAAGAAVPDLAGSAGSPGMLQSLAVLQGWRGGRIDIQGGTLNWAGGQGPGNGVSVQIRSASLRRRDNEWNVAALMFLPDQVGRSARLTLRVAGDLGMPATLAGAARVEARRLLFPGSRELLASLGSTAAWLPRGGHGDLDVALDFAHGSVFRVAGNIRAAGLLLDSAPRPETLVFERLRGNWTAERREHGWHVSVESLDLQKGAHFAALTVDTETTAAGPRVRGSASLLPLGPLLGAARWLAPHLDLAGVQLEGTARTLTFDWDQGRPVGERLQTSADLRDVSLTPQSHDFVLSGLAARLDGSEGHALIDVQSHAARLELTQSQQQPLTQVKVASKLTVSSGPGGWQVATDGFRLEHERATLNLSGSLQDDPAEPRIFASGSLTGADVPLVMRLLGAGSAEAFGPAASRLTAGRIQNAEFVLRGPLSSLPFDAHGSGFTGSLTLRDAVVSGGSLWPDLGGINAHVEWHGAQIRASLESGHAGDFELASATAQWAADATRPARLTGHVTGRLEDALAWVREHPGLQGYMPAIQEVDARGNAAFDFDVSVSGVPLAEPTVVARLNTVVGDASLQALAGMPPIQGINGSFAFNAGRLQRSALTGRWLDGPVTLRIGERREHGARVIGVQAQGSLDARRLAAALNAPGSAAGRTDWSGEFSFTQADGDERPRWRMRADSNLLGVATTLPQPFAKAGAAALPLHIDIAGTDGSAQVRAALGDRLRSVLALKRGVDSNWALDRGAVRVGSDTADSPALPAESALVVRGRLSELDLAAYALGWQRLRPDLLPVVRAQVSADRLWVAGYSYEDVRLRAERSAAGTDLLLDSAGVAGMLRLPAQSPGGGRGGSGEPGEPDVPAELRLSRLALPGGLEPDAGVGLFAALTAAGADISVDELSWRGHSLGRLTASIAAAGQEISTGEVRLTSAIQDARAALRCRSDLSNCRLTFRLDSGDALSVLQAYGLAPELSAGSAVLTGDLQFSPRAAQSWPTGLSGSLSMQFADGEVRSVSTDPAPRFVLSSVPALMSGVDMAGSATATAGAGASAARPGATMGAAPDPGAVSDAAEAGEAVAAATDSAAAGAVINGVLPFQRLAADFEIRDGDAVTSNLHLDGEAEILMRGRTGLANRDYDQHVWLLRGEERLPEALRRFGATPRVAAAWLSLRDLFRGSGSQQRSSTQLRLQGSWDAPMVVAEK